MLSSESQRQFSHSWKDNIHLQFNYYNRRISRGYRWYFHEVTVKATFEWKYDIPCKGRTLNGWPAIIYPCIFASGLLYIKRLRGILNTFWVEWRRLSSLEFMYCNSWAGKHLCSVLVTCASFSNRQLTDNKAPSGRWIGCIYEVMSVGQEVMMMNGGRPLKGGSFPCHCAVAVAGRNVGNAVSTRRAALSGKWLCNRRLTSAAAIKVVVAGS